MAGGAVATVERFLLGLTFTRFRKESGVTQAEAARALGTNETRISKFEDGVATFEARDLQTLIDLYGIPKDKQDNVLRLGIEAKQRASARKAPYLDLLPDSFARFADLEAKATRILCFDLGIMPGLLQCREYIDALMLTTDSGPAVRESRINYRLERQRRVLEGGSGDRFAFVIGEAALHATVGAPGVMRAQLAYLLSLAHSRPAMPIQLLPFGAGFANSHIIFLFGEPIPTIAYEPLAYGPSLYYDDPDITAKAIRTHHRITDLALSPEETKKAIMQKLEEL